MVMSSLGYSPLSINLSASAPSLNRMEAAFRFLDNDLILNDNNTILLRSNFFRVEMPLKNYQGKYGQMVETLHTLSTNQMTNKKQLRLDRPRFSRVFCVFKFA